MNRTILSAAALSAVVVGAPAFAQSLALSYGLERRAEATQQSTSTVNRCAGFNWVNAIEACGRDLLARVLPARGEVASVPASELPALGPHVAETRAVAVPGAGRTADVLFRFGSKHRFKSNDDSTWDGYRFKDVNYESYVKNHGHKAVAVELHVPFQ